MEAFDASREDGLRNVWYELRKLFVSSRVREMRNAWVREQKGRSCV